MVTDGYVQDLLAEAISHKVAGNAHFTAQRTNAALESYRQALAILPVRKPEPKKDIKGKGRAKGSLDTGEDFDDDDEEGSDREADQADSKPESGGADPQIRELQDEDDEKAFIAQDTRTEEEKQLIELRSTLWGNVSACELRLVCPIQSFKRRVYSNLATTVTIQGGRGVG